MIGVKVCDVIDSGKDELEKELTEYLIILLVLFQQDHRKEDDLDWWVDYDCEEFNEEKRLC